MYRLRWQIEILFRNLKHVLRMANFVSTTENGLRIQMYAALIHYCTLANFRHAHVNILLGPPGIKAQSTRRWQNGICQPLNSALGRMRTGEPLVV